ncbi:hypothetical protein [Methanosalsum natronophilum]|uniref:DUF4405 domain-containing protein n=1 Tax=Methanosalsum natronophilum TaxID=768733 RepID=A0A424Z4I4_9EURY|nr:hypothetical protein [Methanosalsum natronophilum]MCS3923734.1 high-affinity Fe2+/Pb2+ permease [Methanosalsum natronophilum]RQD92240.1 MAG: hypothetical protein D5R95_00570 [Methanosalsum natronophilum]
MKKSTINFIVASLMFLVLMGLIGSGLSLWLVMHVYETIHLFLGSVMVILVLIHLYLHKTQIVKMYERLIPDPNKRKVIALGYTVICLILLSIFIITLNGY